MRFFSDQRRDTEETKVALALKKQNALSEIRTFFSSIIKSCMDIGENAITKKYNLNGSFTGKYDACNT